MPFHNKGRHCSRRECARLSKGEMSVRGAMDFSFTTDHFMTPTLFTSLGPRFILMSLRQALILLPSYLPYECTLTRFATLGNINININILSREISALLQVMWPAERA